nr:hypothetical protein [Tanacetum cinerariifolium]
MVKTVNDEARVQALIDAKRVNIKESSIFRTLKLIDEEGTSCLANDEIFTGLANMGYEKISDKKQKSKKQQPKELMVPSPESPPEHTIPSPSNDLTPNADKDRLKFQELMDLCTRLSNKVLDLESEVIDIKSSFTDKIEKLKDRVHKLEEENWILKEKSFMYAKIDSAAPVEDKEESFKKGRMIEDIDKELSMQDIDEEEPAKGEEVLEVVTAAKLITKVVTTAEPTTTATQVLKASAPRRRRGVVIKDPGETVASIIMHTKQDKAFARELEAELNANINWNDVIEKVKRSERQNNAVMRYKALKRKPLIEAQERKNMIIYLKNMAGFKMNFFRGMTYSEIRPLFEKHYNSIQAFLEKVEEDVTVQEKEIKEEEPKNFSDDFLLNILKIMFENPDIEANVWKDQKGIYGLAKVKS